MNKIDKISLLSGHYKDIEQVLVDFFLTIGESSSLRTTSTTIFAYFKIYQTLTQDQLRTLTNFSKSTISSTLTAFNQSNIIKREKIPAERKYFYHLLHEKMSFEYLVFSDSLEKWEKLDHFIDKLQSELQVLPDKIRKEANFFKCRLNSIRNYIEAQRRAISGGKGADFFPEICKNRPGEKSEGTYIITYPPEIEEMESKFVARLTQHEFFSENQSIHNYILGYFSSRMNLDQQTLQKLTGYSPSTISRFLTSPDNLIKSYPKSYQKARIYYFESPSLTLIEHILAIDHYIFEHTEKFNQLLEELQREDVNQSDTEQIKILRICLQRIIKNINELREGSQLLEHAGNDLTHFLSE